MELRDLGGGTDTRIHTEMRVRAALRAALERGVEVFVQMQDVRTWGEETSTVADFSADHLDLHQGYVALRFGGDEQTRLTLGRQETSLGGQRLVGAVDWTPQGRSFDGLRLTTAVGQDAHVDLLAYKLREDEAGGDAEADLFGAYGTTRVRDAGDLDLYLLFDRMASTASTERATFGARFSGARSGFTYRGEATLQRGTLRGLDTDAYMLGARVGRTFHEDRGSVTLWYDVLSGDSDPVDGTVRVFDTLFGTNHKFYGFADLFLNIPAHTGGLGLRDAAIKASYAVREDLQVSVDLHHFETAERGAVPSSSLGQELDLTLSFAYSPSLSVQAGHSYVRARDALLALGRANGDVQFSYVSLNARF